MTGSDHQACALTGQGLNKVGILLHHEQCPRPSAPVAQQPAGQRRQRRQVQQVGACPPQQPLRGRLVAEHHGTAHAVAAARQAKYHGQLPPGLGGAEQPPQVGGHKPDLKQDGAKRNAAWSRSGRQRGRQDGSWTVPQRPVLRRAACTPPQPWHRPAPSTHQHRLGMEVNPPKTQQIPSFTQRCLPLRALHT